MADDTENTEETAPEQAGAGFLESLRATFRSIVVLERYEIKDTLGNTYEFRPVLSARQEMEVALRVDDLRSGGMDRITALQEEGGQKAREAADVAEAKVREAGRLDIETAEESIQDEEKRAEVIAALQRRMDAQAGNARSYAGQRVQLESTLTFIRETLTDDAVAADVQRIWECIHGGTIFGPGLWDRAVANARQAAEANDATLPSNLHALDLFPTDAIMQGLTPFFARSATGIIETLETWSTPVEDQPSSPPSRMLRSAS